VAGKRRVTAIAREVARRYLVGRDEFRQTSTMTDGLALLTAWGMFVLLLLGLVTVVLRRGGR
jgi:hypothetical protein